jgi:hypothetical protein
VCHIVRQSKHQISKSFFHRLNIILLIGRIFHRIATMRLFSALLGVTALASTGTDAFMGLAKPAMATRTAFLNPSTSSNGPANNHAADACRTVLAMSSGDAPVLKRVPADQEGIPIPFVDKTGNSFIECYADSVAIVDGAEYTIGVPCDYSVALCYFDDEDQLVPVELDDKLMDDLFPLAESIVGEEFGEELVLQRTPQTLTLVGELDDDDEEDFEEDDELSTEDDEAEEDEEEVEVLLSFEFKGKEFSLVRMLDPILLVGKVDPNVPDNRILLTPDESDAVMPRLEEMFLEFHDDPDNLLP